MTATQAMTPRTTDPPLRYVESAVTMAEVPGEISLTVSISNCLCRCHGCHSPHLQKDIGKPLQRDLDALISRYKGLFTCVCLMGEGQNPAELKAILEHIRRFGLKTCLYTGCATSEPFKELLPLLDYLKIGPYISSLGGLNSPTTNQRFYRVENGTLTDQTYLFQRRTTL